MSTTSVIWWIRRDFRLAENPALVAAVTSGAPVIPVFIFDEVSQAFPAAPLWRTGLGLEALSRSLRGNGSRLILRKGPALAVLRDLVAETGAREVHWNRLYEPRAIMRDKAVKLALSEAGITAQSHQAHVLFEPWTVETGQGGFYRVYSPFWRAVEARLVPAPEAAPARIAAPDQWPGSDDLADWQMAKPMMRGAGIVRPHLCVGEDAALDRLRVFIDEKLETYGENRDRLDVDGASSLSEPLSYGEIGPRRLWHAGLAARHRGVSGAEKFLKEIVWREFAQHLVFHSPHILDGNWRSEWDGFPWSTAEAPEVLAWKQGRTGIDVIDAAMRELYVTGRMHNRARMLVASYLTKHMMVHWRVGMNWFAETLVDWDPASNAMGWQWVAGSGPDAAPYFRIFNPETQAKKFDPAGSYRRRWLARDCGFFDAVPRHWNLAPDTPRPLYPIVGLAEGRARALAAYEARKP